MNVNFNTVHIQYDKVHILQVTCIFNLKEKKKTENAKRKKSGILLRVCANAANKREVLLQLFPL